MDQLKHFGINKKFIRGDTTSYNREGKPIMVDGKIIYRKPKYTQMGNFQMQTVTHKGDEYIIGSGAEYLQGEPEYYELGKKLSKRTK